MPRPGRVPSPRTLLCGRQKAISHARLGPYVSWVCCVVAEFAPDPVDEDADVFPFVRVLRSPHLLEKHPVGEDFPAMLDQLAKQLVFNWGQPYLLAGNGHDAFGEVDC